MVTSRATFDTGERMCDGWRVRPAQGRGTRRGGRYVWEADHHRSRHGSDRDGRERFAGLGFWRCADRFVGDAARHGVALRGATATTARPEDDRPSATRTIAR